MIKVLIGFGFPDNATPSHWPEWFLFLDQPSVGAILEPDFLSESRFFYCWNEKNWFEIRQRVQTGSQTALLEKG